MKNLILILSSFFIVNFLAAQDCHIYDLIAEKSECNDSGYYNIVLNFSHENTSDSFIIDGYGKFAYSDLPVTLYGFEGNGQGIFFHIFDYEIHECGLERDIEGKHCENDCEIGALILTRSDCDSTHHFNVTIDFDYARTSDSFTLKGNGHNYGTFAYVDLPIVIDGLDGNFDGVFEFVVQDILHPDCKHDAILEPPYCPDNNDCHIHDLIVNFSDCDSNGLYNITLNFQHQNTSDSFAIEGYGIYAYSDLPVTLYGFQGNGDGHLIKISDKEHPDCGLHKEINGKFCDGSCEIGEIHIMKSLCNDNHLFYVKIDFDYSGTSDSFTLKGNGHNYGTFAYADLPIVIDGLDGNFDGVYEFVVQDIHNPDCKNHTTLEPPYCQDNNDCHIYDLVAEYSDCDSNGRYRITLNFQYQNTSDSFSIGGYGTYAYTDLPITLHGFEGNGHGIVFEIFDNENHDCGLRKELHGKDCDHEDCHLSDPHLAISNCNNENQFYVLIDFNSQETSDSFSVRVNGTLSGVFAYDDLPIATGPYNGSLDDTLKFLIRDREYERCATDGRVLPPYCDEGDSLITDIFWETLDCRSEESFFARVNINHNIPADLLLDVYQGDNLLATSIAANFPLQILVNTHDSPFLTIQDHQNPSNFQVYQIAFPDCENSAINKVDDTYFVSPNPFQNEIEIQGTRNAQVNLFNMEGRVIQSNTGQNIRMNVKNVKTGVYILQIKDGTSNHYFKLIKL